jgi:tellurite resistance protein
MTSKLRPSYTSKQISVWLRGLLTIAWADSHFDVEEQNLIVELIQQPLTEDDKSKALEPISPAELAEEFKHDPETAENFLRMAVMVALADGEYSLSEDEVLHQFCQALDLNTDIFTSLRLAVSPSTADTESNAPASALVQSSLTHPELGHPDHRPLSPVRDWLDQLEIHDPKLAHFLCKMIPAQCPFERDIYFFGHKVAHIPPMCKLNPLYEQLVGLRFRALSYLADEHGEDISQYF